MSNKPGKIILTTEALQAEDINKVVKVLEEGSQVPLVRTVGEMKKSSDGIITILVLLGAGLFSGVLTWVSWNIMPKSEDVTFANMFASFSLTLMVAAVLVLADGALSRSAKKLGMNAVLSIPTAIVLALIFGYIANLLYSALVNDVTATAEYKLSSGELNYDQAVAYLLDNMHVPRGLAWSLLCLAADLSVGVASKAIRRIAITGLGGLVGGFIGGFVFDYIAKAAGTNDGAEDIAQVSGLLVTGGLIGLSVSLLEQVTKQSWIEIVRGGMAGKQFILYQREVTVGSSPNANITLIKDPELAPIAAVIKRRGTQVVIASSVPNTPVMVDGVAGYEIVLREGSLIVLGTTELRFRERSKKVSNTTIVRGK